MSFELRPYQKHILGKFKSTRDNLFVVMPTGAGKTQIAFEAICHSTTMRPERIAVFLAPTNDLLKQQAQSFKDQDKDEQYIVRSYSGGQMKIVNSSSSMNLAFSLQQTSRTGRRVQKKAYFFTPQTFFNQLTKGDREISFQNISLIVMDECHHVIIRLRSNNRRSDSAHPYSQIMKLFWLSQNRAECRILGLTASPGEVGHDVIQLCRKLHAKGLTLAQDHLESLESYGVTIPPITFHHPSASDDDSNWLACLRSLEKIKRYQQGDAQSFATELLCATRTQGFNADMIHELKDELGVSVGVVQHVLLVLAKALDISFHDGPDAFQVVSPFYNLLKSDLFASYLSWSERYPSSSSQPAPHFAAIIFVSTRAAAKLLERRLRHDEDLGFVRPSSLVGVTSSTPARNEDILKSFKTGKSNVLIATSVAEEGIDVPNCSLVVRTEPPSTVLNMIQSRGRARYPSSTYVVNCVDEDEEEKVLSQLDQEEELLSLIENANAEYASTLRKPILSISPPFDDTEMARILSASLEDSSGSSDSDMLDVSQASGSSPFHFSTMSNFSVQDQSSMTNFNPQDTYYKSRLNELIQAHFRNGDIQAVYSPIKVQGPNGGFTSEVRVINQTTGQVYIGPIQGRMLHAKKKTSEQEAAFQALRSGLSLQ